ncbi:hypothetical protein INR49_027800 [Caranx melampygus]|nr:hypothetical protein INR49_027800 [Caranx melampygus]
MEFRALRVGFSGRELVWTDRNGSRLRKDIRRELSEDEDRSLRKRSGASGELSAPSDSSRTTDHSTVPQPHQLLLSLSLRAAVMEAEQSDRPLQLCLYHPLTADLWDRLDPDTLRNCSPFLLPSLFFYCLNGEAGFPGTCAALVGCRARCWGFCCQGVRAEGDEAVAVVSSKLFWCACVRRWLPLAYREELYHVLVLTGPLLLARILNFLLPFVISIFCGHIGNAELAGYALASATINLTTTATGFGLSLACDTLIAQTFGSKNMKRVGVILQRSSLILLLFCLPCWGLLINAQNLLLLIQQEDEVARIAQLYVMAFIPAVPALFLHQLQVAYLQNQGIILPQMYTAAAANILNLGFNYVLISSLSLGVIWKKLHVQTWGGWSTDCLQDWGSYMKLALPSMLMVCFEWWIWEIGGFMAGVLGEVDLAAQHVLVEIGAITYMVQCSGAGETSRAIVTCKVALALSGVLAVFQGIVIAGCKSTCVCSGILVGSGMQKIAALSNLVCYYFIALPVGIALMFAAKLRVLEYYSLYLAQLRAGKKPVVIPKRPGSTILNEAMVPDVTDPNTAQLNSEEVPKADGYSLVNTENQEVKAGFEAKSDNNNAGGADVDAEQSKNNASTKCPELLSVTQLILRRGLTFLAAVLILAIGVACHFAFPPPEPSARSTANFTEPNWANGSTPTPSAPLDLSPNL